MNIRPDCPVPAEGLTPSQDVAGVCPNPPRSSSHAMLDLPSGLNNHVDVSGLAPDARIAPLKLRENLPRQPRASRTRAGLAPLPDRGYGGSR